MRYIYLLFIALFCCVGTSQAQRVPAWGGGADLTDFSFGFSFSYVTSYLKIDKQLNWQQPFPDVETGGNLTPGLRGISLPNAPGFAVGLLARYTLTSHLEARTTPSIVFADRKLIYYYLDNTTTEKQVNNTMIDLPVLLKLKSDRLGDLRGYLIGGVKLSGAVGRKNDDAEKGLLDKMVKNKRMYASYEVGVGCDIYFEFFKMSPEVKLSNSIGNILVRENHPYSTPLSGLGLHTIQFSLYFE
ncbi:MAG: PorT family protein [Sphingobacteriaceae bacterium]|nr:MAG: PorT family protein [Sphingobacteriaceae bacterium]